MRDLLYVMLTRDISCLTVATVHFTSPQVALIFLLCGFLLLSLTSVILVFCGLQDFFVIGKYVELVSGPKRYTRRNILSLSNVCIVKSSH